MPGRVHTSCHRCCSSSQYVQGICYHVMCASTRSLQRCSKRTNCTAHKRGDAPACKGKQCTSARHSSHQKLAPCCQLDAVSVNAHMHIRAQARAKRLRLLLSRPSANQSSWQAPAKHVIVIVFMYEVGEMHELEACIAMPDRVRATQSIDPTQCLQCTPSSKPHPSATTVQRPARHVKP